MGKSVFGIIVGTRGFFNPKLAFEGRRQIMNRLDELGFSYVILSEGDTPYGCVETLEHAKKCAGLFRQNAGKINGIIISLPNFGDEIGATESVKLSGLNVPLLVHAFDDELGCMDLAHRRDAFCGKLSVCNNLYQYGIPFTDTAFHTSSVDSKTFECDINRFDRICRVFNGIKGCRVSQLGVRPGAFKTVRYSEKLLERNGITVVPADMSELFALAESITDEKLISNTIAEIKEYGRVDCTGFDCDVPRSLEKTARFTIAVSQWMKENECVAGCIQCWDSIEKNYNCAACLTMSMLGEKGIPFACETDVQGAIAMYALYLASDNPPGYLDWNNSYGEDRNMCINFHCSNYPKSFFGTEPTISCLDILGASLGYHNCFGALKAQVRGGNFTYSNIKTNDFKGEIEMYTGEGVFVDEPVNTVGSPAVCKIPDLQSLMKYLCKNGFSHHVAMNRGNHADVIEEVFGNYFGWKVYKHI